MRLIFTFLLSLICLVSPLIAQDTSDTSPADAAVVQQKVREWVRVRKLIAEESANWEGEKRQLAELNALREKEITQLDEYITAAGNRLKAHDEERQQLSADEGTLRTQRNTAEKTITELETKLRSQFTRFPEPLYDSISDAIARVEQADPDAPLQNRWRDVLAILSEVTRFQNDLTVHSEIRDLNGIRTKIDILYLGLNQAYYVSSNGKNAGTGIPSANGWQWTVDNSIASEVSDAIEISRNKGTPEFVTLPVSGASK